MHGAAHAGLLLHLQQLPQAVTEAAGAAHKTLACCALQMKLGPSAQHKAQQSAGNDET
jgi:hypothetical protein